MRRRGNTRRRAMPQFVAGFGLPGRQGRIVQQELIHTPAWADAAPGAETFPCSIVPTDAPPGRADGVAMVRFEQVTNTPR